MEKKSVIGGFVNNKKSSLIYYVLCSGILFLIAWLYSVLMEAVIYGVLLTSVIGLIWLLVDFAGYAKRHADLQRSYQGIERLYKDLPEAKDLLELDYQQLLGKLGEDNQQRNTNWKSKQKESIEYYTTWVHQIKTPICAMSMILQSKDTPDYRELGAELFRIEQYVEMVLWYLRLGENNSDYLFQECNLDEIIRSSIRKYAPQFIRQRLCLVYEGTDVVVVTDAKWLAFLIEQILSNAIKYTKKGCVTIWVSQDLKLSIEDTGIGIASEDLPRIFEKGFTGYNGRTNKKATGIGLYLCKQISERLAISLEVSSKVGEGSVFTIDLEKENREG